MRQAKGYVYLITSLKCDGDYKIGVTKNNNVLTRKDELQTGNSDELFIHTLFPSSNAFKLEKFLHKYYCDKRKLNEWFTLDETDVKNFIDVCQKYENIIVALKNNPFFK